MSVTAVNLRQLEATAAAAIGRGDGQAALGPMRTLSEHRPDDPAVWMYLGEAARLAGDDATLGTAADRLLALQPRAVRALIWKGDVLERGSNARLACGFYSRAVRLAETMDPVPASLQPELLRASEAVERLEAVFADHLDRALSVNSSSRLRRAANILAGRASIHLQQPTQFYLPGLAQREFFERKEFAWAGEVELATPAIRAELGAALGEQGLFSPYLTSDHGEVPRDRTAVTDSADWSALHLMDKGEVKPDMAERFPATLAALTNAPLCRVPGRAPTVMFSLLKAGARIPPHHGVMNARLICHLPLLVPGEGKLRVGGEARGWTEGQLLIFDDSIEHEAWNEANEDRVVLIFDVWRPDVTEDERAGVAAVFGAVDDYGGHG